MESTQMFMYFTWYIINVIIICARTCLYKSYCYNKIQVLDPVDETSNLLEY